MKISDLAKALKATYAVAPGDPDEEITCGYACDLLSWVLAHGQKGMAWTTVQTHVNVVAIAVLMEMGCVILAEGNKLENASLSKAVEEKMPVLETAMTAYEVCGILYGAGIPAPRE